MSFVDQKYQLIGSSGSGDAVAYSSSNIYGQAIPLGASSQSFMVSSNQASDSERVGQIARDLLTLNSSNQAYNGSVNYGVSYESSNYASGGNVMEASAYSSIEQAILRANNPIQINETDMITVNGQTGLWANKQEIANWRGVIPIQQYLINEDANPEVIRKRTEQQLVYDQEIAIRYLRPPTPPPPGEIIIRQEKNIPTPPAPPLVIRQQPPRPETPAPLVVREAPPRPPAQIGTKVVTISGKRLPPAPRKVVIERLAPLPSKPQSVFIERWLPYNQQKRRVIFQRSNEPDPIVSRPRNVIVQWEAPNVTIKKEFKDLGVIRANPAEYVQRYGATLKSHVELPSFVREIRPPSGVVLAAEYQAPSVFELEGDVQALSLIDLDREGLGEYRSYLRGGYSQISYGAQSAFNSGASASFSSYSSQLNSILAELFSSIDINADGRVSISECEKLLLRLNSRLGRRYGEDDVNAFFRQLDVNSDGRVDFEEFKRGILRELSL